MRIVLVTTSFPRFEGDPSGHFVATEAAGLQRAGHRVLVLAPGDDREAPSAHLPVVGLGADSLFRWPGALPRARERPHRLLALPAFLHRARRELSRRGPFDRVISHFLLPCGFPLGLVAEGALEVVAHGSDVRLLVRLPKLLRERIMASLLDREATFRFASERLRDELMAALPPSLAATVEARSRVELPPISLPDVSTRAGELRRSSRLSDGEELWLSCARLIPSKRVDRAIAEAARHRARLVVVGDGPERPKLEAWARELDARAHFVGQVARDEALAWMAAADRLLHLSEAEGAPTVVREARALGTPVLATAVGDIAKWAEEDPGIEIAPSA